MDNDDDEQIERQLLDGHTYPCAIDMHAAEWYKGAGERRAPKHSHSGRWLYGKRYLKRCTMLGNGNTLIAVILN